MSRQKLTADGKGLVVLAVSTSACHFAIVDGYAVKGPAVKDAAMGIKPRQLSPLLSAAVAAPYRTIGL
jgi:hypothetical protein